MIFDLLDLPWSGALASLCAGSATALGAAAVFCVPKNQHKLKDALMSFAAGVMLAAAFFGLIIPGLNAAKELGFEEKAGFALVAAGIVLGAGFVWLLNRCIPHEHFEIGHHGPISAVHLKKIWLFVIAIAIHNLPEGMAVGVSFAGDNWSNGFAISLGIGLQNIPEGFAVAIALLSVGYRRLYSFAVASLTGLLEFIGGSVGVLTLGFSHSFYPTILGFAGGAMLFIISDEIIPESHSQGHETLATLFLVLGLVVMMAFDVLL